jgi:mannose-6-phosphate isomerase-like protein (cupin superfamily)
VDAYQPQEFRHSEFVITGLGDPDWFRTASTYHEPEQVYYIIKGKGLMTIVEEAREVFAGDAVYIPGKARHGIKNIGDENLEYITANSPVFSGKYESTLWPAEP